MKESYIKQLIRILEDSDIDTLEISSFWGMKNIKLSKGISQSLLSQTKTIPTNTPEIISKEFVSTNSSDELLEENPPEEIIDSKIQDKKINNTAEPEEKESQYITAPLVGTFYLSPKPEDPPFIKKGDKINIGQTICIIEAMKIFNEIESEVAGIIEDILDEDMTPVEYGQKIISIKLDD